MSVSKFGERYPHDNVFNYMRIVAQGVIKDELTPEKLELSVQELTVTQIHRTYCQFINALVQNILDKIQKKILEDPDVEKQLQEKGYSSSLKARDYETEVIDALDAHKLFILKTLEQMQSLQIEQSSNSDGCNLF
jgi:hypothetical protein